MERNPARHKPYGKPNLLKEDNVKHDLPEFGKEIVRNRSRI